MIELKSHSLVSPVTTYEDVTAKLYLLVLTCRDQDTTVVFLSGEHRVPSISKLDMASREGELLKKKKLTDGQISLDKFP